MIKIEHAKKSYKNFNLDCSLTIPKGYISGIIGSNGAGKSTTLKLLLGLTSLEDGTIEIFGKKVENLNVKDKEQLGVVLTDTGFSEYLCINDIIKVLYSIYKRFDKQLFISLCTKFQLPMNKRVKDFSSGMKAKLKTIIAISHEAKVLILDEVTTGLDVIARNEILDLLQDYMEKDSERTILISSHISSDLECLCDNIYMMKEGRIVFYEEMDILLSNYAVLKLDEEQYKEIDKSYIISRKKEAYGFLCLAKERQYYIDNYPNIVIEKSSIDKLMLIMNRGEILC
jgi:ABC-2 type transport system ATP-binding protein